MRGAAFRRPDRGVRVAGPGTAGPEGDRDDMIAGLAALARPDQCCSHSTAALLHGIPLPRRLERGPVHVAAPSEAARMRRPGVVGHRLVSRVVEVAGLRCEAPEDAFVHLGMLLSIDELVAVGDWLVHPRRPGALTVADLADTVRRYRGARGIRKVEHALLLVRPGAESPKETELRLDMLRAGLPMPVLQHELREPDGTAWARLDLAYPSLKLAIEYDGEQHRLDDAQYDRDVRRLRRLAAEGWLVIRVTKADLRLRRSVVLAQIAAAHAARTAERVLTHAGR